MWHSCSYVVHPFPSLVHIYTGVTWIGPWVRPILSAHVTSPCATMDGNTWGVRLVVTHLPSLARGGPNSCKLSPFFLATYYRLNVPVCMRSVRAHVWWQNTGQLMLDDVRRLCSVLSVRNCLSWWWRHLACIAQGLCSREPQIQKNSKPKVRNIFTNEFGYRLTLLFLVTISLKIVFPHAVP